MTSPTLQPIEIEIRVAGDGAITPLRYRLVQQRAVWQQVGQVSRHWSDEAGDHWLVMTVAPDRVVELIRTPDGIWQAKDSPVRRAV